MKGSFLFMLVARAGLVLAVLLFLAAWHLANRRIAEATRALCFDDATRVPKREVGLVLGCTRYLRTGRPNRYFAHRIDAAAALFHAGKIDRVLVSGASHRGEVDEAQSMKEALIEQGVPEGRIVCDHFGYRTIDSVLRASEVFDCREFVVISQRFHIERALYVTRHRGIDAIGFAARDVSRLGGRAVRGREVFARIRALLDVHVLGTRPRTLERG